MYQDEIFENALKEAREENYRALKQDVSEVEKLIEKMLAKFLECSTAVSERDYNILGI